MPRPLSNDLRIRMVNAVQNGESRHAVAERFDVAPSSVIKLMQAFEATGSHEPKRMGGYKTFKLAGHEALVCGLIAEVPDATLDELVARLRKAPVSARHPSPQGKGHDQPHRPVAVSGQSQPQL